MNAKFWAKVNKETPSGCWEWTAAKFWHGYGCFGVRQADGKYKTKYAHRISWEEANGPIENDLFVLHKCDNRSCVNPEHLFLGTQLDNMRDCSRKGRKIGQILLGEANASASLNDAKVKIIRYVGSKLSQQRLAKEFGVSQTNIGHILRGSTWKHVKVVS